MTSKATQWFARRTYRADHADPSELAERKVAAGLTVSVVLPARNEAPTIAGVVDACMSLHPQLVDEIVVVDGASDDGTAQLAAKAGATVVADADLLPEFGPALGKGDALWRSLTAVTGDVIAFCDTDIRNPDPRFVWALLGPLLADPEIQFVKAFYERPVQLDTTLYSTGGGRVTELTARPLLNLFWPELAGLVQPLSGEYAGRRTLLEQLPFFTGYGVEVGLLIDTLDRCGANAIAQVDLVNRIHRNQSIASLSRMAYGIMQVAALRLSGDGRVSLEGDAPPQRYLQFERDDDDLVHIRERDIAVVERPAIADLQPAQGSARSHRTP